MELDPQSIERRDFPIARRGYEPATVDAHLRAVASEVQQLREEVQQGGVESLASSAGSQVQGILQAAEATAAEIVRQAQASARQTREAADRDAEQTRADAIARAEAHGAAVAAAGATLLGRVESLDGEVETLVQSVRAGAGRLSGDLATLDASMADLYDASSGRAPSVADSESPPTPPPTPPPAPEALPAAPPVSASPLPAASAAAPAAPAPTPPLPTPAEAQPVASTPAAGPTVPAPAATPSGGDLDGARLIALNMALNGDSREMTSRYITEHFQLADSQRLIDEVYAAIEG